MSKRYLWVIAVAFLIIASTTVSRAEEAEKTEKVVVSGFGLDPDKAKENAVMNAVDRVIGIYVASESIVRNSRLIKDEILSYSGGYVKETKVLSQGKGGESDGLFTVQIEATVVSTKLKRKLESLNIATNKVEGESLFGEAVSRIKEQKGASELLGNTLSKYPQAAYSIEVGKPEIKSTDQNKNTARVSIPLTIRWDNAFIEELKDVLSKVSKEELKMVELMTFMGMDKTKEFNDSKILCFSRKAILKSAKAEVCEIITNDLYKDAISKGNLNKENNLMGVGAPPKKLSLSIYFKDKENNIIDSTIYEIDRVNHGGRDSFKRQGITVSDSFTASMLENVSDYYYLNPNTLWGGKYHLLIVTDGVYNMEIEADINVTTLSKAATVEVQAEPWKGR